jgi:hypothetical protein
MCHTYCDTGPPFLMSSERSVILTSECCAVGEGAITTYFNVVGLTQTGRAGLELKASRMPSESTTTRLPQPVLVMSKSVRVKYSQPDKRKSNNKSIICTYQVLGEGATMTCLMLDAWRAVKFRAVCSVCNNLWVLKFLYRATRSALRREKQFLRTPSVATGVVTLKNSPMSQRSAEV